MQVGADRRLLEIKDRVKCTFDEHPSRLPKDLVAQVSAQLYT